ncbi:SCO family protein [Polynucleobacter sp. MWH-UH35A]|uniref:SCO family protein n=1 Tax=Polynucleobacter sp. MWH-UH35A TaxID=1855619 RepID=UPI001BFDD6A1|nr:SCO family protein [Polynucleobacter sp. MWH-UH35A]QWD59526.1 SCO family protein [Polynucleobacter sp. MWH-UH35A]
MSDSMKMNLSQTSEIYECFIAGVKRWLYRALIDCLIFNNNLYVPNQRFQNDDITDLKSFGSEFSLIDIKGNARSLASFKGRIVVLVVGRALADDPSRMILKNIVHELSVTGQQPLPVDLVFITIDPENDSPEDMENYLSEIDSGCIGLRPRNISDAKKFAKDFLIYLNKVQLENSVAYCAEPIRSGLVFDQEGCLRLYLGRQNGVKNLRHDLLQLFLGY